MKRLITLLIFFGGISLNITFSQSFEYPLTRTESVIDTFFSSYLVEDKYRWLEYIDGEEVIEWVKNQNKFSKKILSKASNDFNSFNLIDKYAYATYNFPVKEGKYYFKYYFLSNTGTRALFIQSSINGEPSILVDPNGISIKDKISIDNYSVSKDSKLLAYQFSRNGSDRKELKVISISSGFHKKDHLTNLRFSHEVAWKDSGFFYSKYEETDQFDKISRQEVFYHKIGTEQTEDQVIFKRDNPNSHFSFFTTSDERFFVLYDSKTGADKKTIYYIDYSDKTPAIKPLLTNIDIDLRILDSHDGKFIASTTYKSKNGSIIEIDPANPLTWRSVAPEFKDAELKWIFPQADRIVALYKSEPHQYIMIYNYAGEILTNLKLPIASETGKFSGEYDDDNLLYSITSYTLPPVVYNLNTRTFEHSLVDQTTVTFDFNTIEYKEVNFLAKDSSLVPIILVYENGLKLNGNNPTLLKAYGGFGISEHPSFDPGIVYFIKQGGVFAFAKIRGGGDKGEEWAKQGRGANKQTTFDDFISAAEYLIKEGYTCPSKLAATGASNGGLVVAAAAIQRPDLFKVVVPVVAPLDMLRFEMFTGGKYWVGEYGNINDSLGFKKLYSYSPYQSIKSDVNYPSMLVMTSDFDDRVAPLHSYKFVAQLQNRPVQTNPVLLRVENKSGHQGASTIYSTIQEEADMYGFIMNELIKK